MDALMKGKSMPPKVSKLTNDQILQMTKSFADAGLLISAGWVGCQAALTNESTPRATVDKLRDAYFSGCQHVFNSIMGILDPGEEPTEADLNRLTLLADELEQWEKTFNKRTQN